MYTGFSSSISGFCLDSWVGYRSTGIRRRRSGLGPAAEVMSLLMVSKPVPEEEQMYLADFFQGGGVGACTEYLYHLCV